MTRARALEELRVMISSLDKTDTEAAAVARLLERISLRVDSLELRAALAEEGARAMLIAAREDASAHAGERT
jgi:hypothetical protein